jgi:hypothetical protein
MWICRPADFTCAFHFFLAIFSHIEERIASIQVVRVGVPDNECIPAKWQLSAALESRVALASRATASAEMPVA